MHITLFSFGFKHGRPDADTVWDIRFLPNPYYVSELKEKTGREHDVAAYVLDNSPAREFFNKFEPFLLSFINSHAGSGRESIRLAIGCTGGKHRSVAVVEYLNKLLVSQPVEVNMHHRDIEKE